MDEVRAQVELHASLWPGFEEADNIVTPHRQRTAVNKLMGFAMFLGMDVGKAAEQDAPINILRSWQKYLGPLRDLDVTRQWLAKSAKKAGEAATPAAETIDEALKVRRAKILEDVRPDARGLPGARTRVALAEAQRQFEEITGELAQADRVFDANAALAGVVIPWKKKLHILFHEHSDDALHSFRVRNKRFRFVLEVLAQVEEGEWGDAIKSRAKTCSDVHTTLGNLSDLHVLREEVRLFRAGWAMSGKELERAGDALERGRAMLEAKELTEWFAVWPSLHAPEFLGDLGAF